MAPSNTWLPDERHGHRAALFGEVGLELRTTELAFMSKVLVFAPDLESGKA